METRYESIDDIPKLPLRGDSVRFTSNGEDAVIRPWGTEWRVYSGLQEDTQTTIARQDDHYVLIRDGLDANPGVSDPDWKKLLKLYF